MAYWKSYLAEKLANWAVHEPAGDTMHEDNNRGVRRLEIYLDESYCNVNHVFRSTWYQKGKSIRGRTSVGQRANILAAFAIGTLPDGRDIAEIVLGSLMIWHGNNKTRGVYTKTKHQDSWAARTLKKAKDLQVLEPLDYHGNVNGDLFEDWLTDLCEQLNLCYGCPCIIYMDGAKSHKRTKPGHEQPVEGWNKTLLTNWLHAHSHPEARSDKSWSKNQLWALAKAKRAHVEKYYQVYDIAADNGGHEVRWTPAYHPELQPIERLWAVVKNDIACNLANNIAELIDWLWALFNPPMHEKKPDWHPPLVAPAHGVLSKKVMFMTLRKTRQWEDFYIAQMLAENPVEETSDPAAEDTGSDYDPDAEMLDLEEAIGDEDDE